MKYPSFLFHEVFFFFVTHITLDSCLSGLSRQRSCKTAKNTRDTTSNPSTELVVDHWKVRFFKTYGLVSKMWRHLWVVSFFLVVPSAVCFRPGVVWLLWRLQATQTVGCGGRQLKQREILHYDDGHKRHYMNPTLKKIKSIGTLHGCSAHLQYFRAVRVGLNWSQTSPTITRRVNGQTSGEIKANIHLNSCTGD